MLLRPFLRISNCKHCPRISTSVRCNERTISEYWSDVSCIMQQLKYGTTFCTAERCTTSSTIKERPLQKKNVMNPSTMDLFVSFHFLVCCTWGAHVRRQLKEGCVCMCACKDASRQQKILQMVACLQMTLSPASSMLAG